jgi:hypothetical protein
MRGKWAKNMQREIDLFVNATILAPDLDRLKGRVMAQDWLDMY